LVVPRELAPRRRSYFPLLAIAATLVLALLAAALWLAIHESGPTRPQQAIAPQPTPPTVVPREVPVPNLARSETPDKRVRPKSSTAPMRQRPRTMEAAMSERERKEAEAVKEQLMLALRMASEKLNQAQRRVQGPDTPNQIRNQHKVG
jgi:hypothetical protein